MALDMTKSPPGPPRIGDIYTMSASGGIKAGSTLTAECLRENPIHIIASVTTPTNYGISKYDITDPSQLGLGTYAVVIVEKGKFKPERPSDYTPDKGGPSKGASTLEAGIINIDKAATGRFDDEEYYIVQVSGGVDVDRKR